MNSSAVEASVGAFAFSGGTFPSYLIVVQWSWHSTTPIERPSYSTCQVLQVLVARNCALLAHQKCHPQQRLCVWDSANTHGRRRTARRICSFARAGSLEIGLSASWLAGSGFRLARARAGFVVHSFKKFWPGRICACYEKLPPSFRAAPII